MTKTVAVIGTLDTKYDDFMYLSYRIRGMGLDVLCIDVGTHKCRGDGADIRYDEVLGYISASPDDVKNVTRNEALSIMGRAVSACVKSLYEKGRINAVVGMGGGGALELFKHVVSVLPIGFPKVFATTFGGTPMITELTAMSDCMVMNSLADISGLNSFTAMIYDQVAGAVSGAVQRVGSGSYKRAGRIAATMFGMTTPCVTRVKELLEEKGYEVIVFHANISGGNLMEKLISEDFFDGVLDLTLTEMNSLSYALTFGRECGVTKHRMEGASARGIPYVACPGALDMCGLTDVVLSDIDGRYIYCHNDPGHPTHFRPSAKDLERTAGLMLEKLSLFKSPCAMVIPLGGFSKLDVSGGELYDPAADRAFIEKLRAADANPFVSIIDAPGNINDPGTAEIIASAMDDMMKEYLSGSTRDALLA